MATDPPAAAPPRPVDHVYYICGGDRSPEAWAEWEADAQEWTLGGYDYAFCHDCRRDEPGRGRFRHPRADRRLVPPPDTDIVHRLVARAARRALPGMRPSLTKIRRGPPPPDRS